MFRQLQRKVATTGLRSISGSHGKILSNLKFRSLYCAPLHLRSTLYSNFDRSNREVFSSAIAREIGKGSTINKVLSRNLSTKPSSSSPDTVSRTAVFASILPKQDEVIRHLGVFPEYQTALKEQLEGKFSSSSRNLSRMKEVIESYMGAGSLPAGLIAMKLAENERYLSKERGHHGDAIDVLEKAVCDKDGRSLPEEIRFTLVRELIILQLDGVRVDENLAKTQVDDERAAGKIDSDLLGIDRAETLAEALVNRAEGAKSTASSSSLSSSSDGGNEERLSFAYGMRGIIALLKGELETAEEYLTMSARWSTFLSHHHQIENGLVKDTDTDTDTSLRELIALNNLACLHWYRDGPGQSMDTLGSSPFSSLLVDDDADRSSSFPSPNSSLEQSESGKKAEVNDEEKKRALKVNEAVAYWEECIELASKGDLSSSSTSQGMCGFGSEQTDERVGSSISNNSSRNSSDSTVYMPAGPGVEVRSVDGTKNSKAAGERVGISSYDALSARLQDPLFCSVYATCLCNLAEAHSYLGQKHSRSELLSSALKAIDNCPKSDGSSTIISLSREIDHDRYVSPVLGRVLTLIARSHLEAGEMMTAEGLLRSAIQTLKSPLSMADQRNRSQLSLSLEMYGRLQLKWEKREREGSRLVAEAEAIRGGQSVWISPRLILSI